MFTTSDCFDVAKVAPLRYGTGAPVVDTSFMNMAIGAVIAFFVLTMVAPPTRRAYPMPVQAGVASMIATVAPSTKVPDLPQASKKMPDATSERMQLISSDTKDEKELKKNEKMLRKLMKSKKTMTIVIFASWCGHCHNMIKEISRVTSESPRCTHPYVLVDADAVASSAFTGENAVYPLEHFPTVIVNKGGDKAVVSSAEEAEATMSTAPVDKKVVDEPIVEEAIVDGEEATSAMLASLF